MSAHCKAFIGSVNLNLILNSTGSLINYRFKESVRKMQGAREPQISAY